MGLGRKERDGGRDPLVPGQRPWTPNSGSDVLLLRPSQDQQTQDRLYQKRPGKLHKLAGVSPSKPWLKDATGKVLAPLTPDDAPAGREHIGSDTASLLSSIPHRPGSSEARSVTSTSALDAAHEHPGLADDSALSSPGWTRKAARTNRGLSRSVELDEGRRGLLMQPVFVKDHSVGKMSDYTAAKSRFSSHALDLETNLRELDANLANAKEQRVRRGELSETGPSPEEARVCLETFGEIARRPGPYQKVLMMLSGKFVDMLFAELPGMPPAPYFALCRQLRADVDKLEGELTEAAEQLVRTASGASATNSVSLRNRMASGAAATKTKDEEIAKAEKEIADLKKLVTDLTRKVNQQQRDLEDMARKMETADGASTQLKGAFLRNKKELLECRCELQQTQDHSNEIFLQMQDMVPKSDYDRLLQQLADARNKSGDMSPTGLSETGSSMEDDNLQFGDDPETTPRPAWKRMPTEVSAPAGFLRTREPTKVCVSKLVTYIKQLQEQNVSLRAQQATLGSPVKKGGPTPDDVTDMAAIRAAQVDQKYIQCLGVGPEVPKYLRFNGRVRNRKMAKRDAEKAIREIWHLKQSHDQAKGDAGRMSMQDFFYEFCRKKFGTFQNVIAEWSYNVLAVLERNTHDVDCNLFLKVLHGELTEDIYYDQVQQIKDCEECAVECDKMVHSGATTGKCLKEDFLRAIREKCSKNFEQMQELSNALDAVYGDKTKEFKYDRMFAEDRNYSQNEFAEEFKDQIIKEREEHVRLLKKLVAQTTDDGQIAIAKFKKKLKLADPEKPDMDISTYVHRGCGVGAAGDMPEHFNANVFEENLLRGVCKLGPLAPQQPASTGRN